MKLLFENWRQFLTEEDASTDPEHAAAIKEAGLVLNRFLGKGKMGVVYEVEDKETGQRLAAKVINKWTGASHDERKNYNWIINNRDNLPNDIKPYVVDVYKLFEDSSNKYLIILMELLVPAPKNVVNQIFAGTEYSMDKEVRILKDEGAVYEIILNVLRANNMIRAPIKVNRKSVSQTEIKETAKKILRNYLVNKKVPESLIRQVYEEPLVYNFSSPQWQNLFNAILNGVEELLNKTYGEIVESIILHAATDIDQHLNHYIKKQVVPMTYGTPQDRPLGGAGPGVTKAFPEVEGILNAMKYLTLQGFNPRDMHTENVMMRPDNNQLVMTDVGLFLVTKENKGASLSEEEEYQKKMKKQLPAELDFLLNKGPNNTKVGPGITNPKNPKFKSKPPGAPFGEGTES